MVMILVYVILWGCGGAPVDQAEKESPEFLRAKGAIQPFLEEFQSHEKKLDQIDLASEESLEWGLDSARLAVLFMEVDGYRGYSPYDMEVRDDWGDSLGVILDMDDQIENPTEATAFRDYSSGFREGKRPLMQWRRGTSMVVVDYTRFAGKCANGSGEQAFFELMDSIANPGNDQFFPPWSGYDGMADGPYVITGSGTWGRYRRRFLSFADNEMVGDLAEEYLEYVDDWYLEADNYSASIEETVAEFRSVLREFPELGDREMLEAVIEELESGER